MSSYETNDSDAFIGELGGDLPPREGGPNLKGVKASAKAAAASAKEAAGVALEEARERARSLAETATERAQHHYGDLEAWVQLKPARALGIAAGIGVVLGLLMRGRSTRVVYLRDH